MADRSYIVIEPYMIDLHLPMTELLCYAIIAGYSKAKQGCFYGSKGYLAENIGVTRQSVQQALGKLEEKKLIKKLENCGRIEYTILGIDASTVDNMQGGLRASGLAGVQAGFTQEQAQLTNGASVLAGGASVFDKGASGLAQYYNNINNNLCDSKVNVNTHTHASHQNTVRKLEPIATNDFCDTGFESPTLEQVKAYVTEAGLCIDPVQFWNYYTARNWTNPTNGRRLDYWQGNAQSWHDREVKEKRNNSKESDKEKRARLADEKLKEIFGD